MAKNVGGRPTKYTENTIDMVNQYVCGDYKKDGSLIPTYEGLADYLRVVVSTVEKWARDDDKPGFSRALEKLKQQQKRNLINNALSGDYNATIAKLVLSANHGMSETSKQEVTGGNGGPQEHKWTVEFVNATPESKP